MESFSTISHGTSVTPFFVSIISPDSPLDSPNASLLVQMVMFSTMFGFPVQIVRSAPTRLENFSTCDNTHLNTELNLLLPPTATCAPAEALPDQVCILFAIISTNKGGGARGSEHKGVGEIKVEKRETGLKFPYLPHQGISSV